MRYKAWLRNPRTGAVWDLSPYAEELSGCLLGGISGLNYKADVKVYDVSTAWFIEDIVRKMPAIKGTLHFRNQGHFERFDDFIKNYQAIFEFHYSPKGETRPDDRFGQSWYKNVVISSFDKNSRNKNGFYEVAVEFTALTIWRRDRRIDIELRAPAAQALIYPYTYPFYYDGGKWLGTIKNDGLPAPLRIELTGAGTSPEWLLRPEAGDYERAKFNVNVAPDRTLIVDSNPENQIAQIVSKADKNYIEQVYRHQEADFDYINFITVPTGTSTMSIDAEQSASIRVSYSEQRDVI